MDMAQLDRARALERTHDRRAARARRSKWLGRMLFSLIGMGLLLLVRLNPGLAADVVAWSHGVNGNGAAPTLSKPTDIHVRKMPSNVVPVRRGGDLPGGDTRAPQPDAQAQADAVGNALRSLSPGG